MSYTAEDLKKLPLRAIVAFAARCARRVERLAVPPDGHPEQERCRSAIAEVLRVAEDFARGLPCPTLESAVVAIEAGQAASQGEVVRENAYSAVVRTAHAATTAAHAIAEQEAPVERRLASPGPPIQPFAHLAEMSAEMAAMGAFTAALDAAEALRTTEDFSKWAAEDYRNLIGLELGKYPQAGKPIDPSIDGPLGPLGMEENTLGS